MNGVRWEDKLESKRKVDFKEPSNMCWMGALQDGAITTLTPGHRYFMTCDAHIGAFFNVQRS
jgi:hypothetical protein